jgi:peptidoglycan/LPS O-acetylase OafA/YrhL
MLALLLRGDDASRWQRLCRPTFLASSAATLAIFALSPGSSSPWLMTVGFTFIALASTALIGSTLRTGSPAFRLFNNKPLRVLGKYSYGFYIFHVIFGWAWIRFLIYLYFLFHRSIALAGLVSLTTNFVVTFVIAKLSYDLYEVKFLRWKRNFEYDSEVAEHKHAFTTK